MSQRCQRRNIGGGEFLRVALESASRDEQNDTYNYSVTLVRSINSHLPLCGDCRVLNSIFHFDKKTHPLIFSSHHNIPTYPSQAGPDFSNDY